MVERDGLDKSAGWPICTTQRVAHRAKYMDVLSENRCTVTRKRHLLVLSNGFGEVPEWASRKMEKTLNVSFPRRATRQGCRGRITLPGMDGRDLSYINKTPDYGEVPDNSAGSNIERWRVSDNGPKGGGQDVRNNGRTGRSRQIGRIADLHHASRGPQGEVHGCTE